MTKIFKFLFLTACMLYSSILSAQNKLISLSFDDAPRGQGAVFSGEERTKALLSGLEKAKTGPVVFFVLTKHLNNAKAIQRIKQYDQAGHLIANHTHEHPWLHKTELQAYLDGIDQAELALAPFKNRRPWFRFPYLDEGREITKRNALRAALEERKLMNGYVTIDNYDWYLAAKWKEAVKAGKRVDLQALKSVYIDLIVSASEFYNNLALAKLNRSPAHTLLLHENDLAAMFIYDLINALKHKGWTIIDPDTAYKDPIAKQHPETLITGQGRVAGLAIDAGANPRMLTHLAIEESQIDALIEERKVFSIQP